MIVVAIIGLVAIIAAPNLSPANARLKEAVRELYGNMQSAKMSAIKDNVSWGIIFDSAANTYTICSNFNYDQSPPDCSDVPGDDGINPETIELTVDLNSYGSSVALGLGDATEDVPGKVCPGVDCPADGISYSYNRMAFQPSGLLRGIGSGYVYLQNNKNTAYAVGTPVVSGVVVTRKWANGAWQ